jgi:hypothetical protein
VALHLAQTPLSVFSDHCAIILQSQGNNNHYQVLKIRMDISKTCPLFYFTLGFSPFNQIL